MQDKKDNPLLDSGRIEVSDLVRMMYANSSLGVLFISAVRDGDMWLAQSCVDFAQAHDDIKSLESPRGSTGLANAYEVAVLGSDAQLMSWLIDSGIPIGSSIAHGLAECPDAISFLMSRMQSDDLLSLYIKSDLYSSYTHSHALSKMVVFESDVGGFFVSTNYSRGCDTRLSSLAAQLGAELTMTRQFTDRNWIRKQQAEDMSVYTYCCAGGFEKSLDAIIERKNLPDVGSFQALIFTQRWGLLKKVFESLSQFEVSSFGGETSAQRARSAFWTAALQSSHLEISSVRQAIDVALECGLSLDESLYAISRDDPGLRCPIHFCGKGDRVGLMVSVGADVDTRDHKGDTLLANALRSNSKGMDGVAMECLRAGADVSQKDSRGRTFKQLSVHASEEVKEMIASRKAQQAVGGFLEAVCVEAIKTSGGRSMGVSL